MWRFAFFFLFIPGMVNSQAGMDSLEVWGKRMLNDPEENVRLNAEKKVAAFIDSVIADPTSWENSFSGLKSIAVLKPEDERFRIFNWNVPYADGTYRFFGRIQFKPTKKQPYTVIPLNDASADMQKPSSKALNAEQWFGALYYSIVPISYKKKTYYTLLGWDGNTAFSNKKLIDVLVLDASNKITFGAPIFDDGKKARFRVFFEHSERVTMSLRYQDKNKWIVFDHLAPSQPSLAGQYEFYGPDFTFDAFQWQKGKWKFMSDVDVRNEGLNQGKNSKKPEKGLTPPVKK
jgi:hypothetical protein